MYVLGSNEARDEELTIYASQAAEAESGTSKQASIKEGQKMSREF